MLDSQAGKALCREQPAPPLRLGTPGADMCPDGSAAMDAQWEVVPGAPVQGTVNGIVAADPNGRR